jgi:multisubunit Na+/H+ antiporter MnhE subunit
VTQPTRVTEARRPPAGEPGDRPAATSLARRAGAWLVWWVVLMSFWVMLDDSIQSDELLAGAGAAALAALVAELVTYQAAARFRMRARWLVPALRLPGEVAADLVTVFGALCRTLAGGGPPRSAFVEIPVRYGDDSAEGVTRRVLLVGGRSVAPNTFVLGIDSERDAMVVHRLVAKAGDRRGEDR